MECQLCSGWEGDTILQLKTKQKTQNRAWKNHLLTFEEWTSAAAGILLSSLGMADEKLFDVHESSAHWPYWLATIQFDAKGCLKCWNRKWKSGLITFILIWIISCKKWQLLTRVTYWCDHLLAGQHVLAGRLIHVVHVRDGLVTSTVVPTTTTSQHRRHWLFIQEQQDFFQVEATDSSTGL